MSKKAHARREKIVELTRQRNLVTVEGLSRELVVSAQTVRRDINSLCRANLLRRRHGGAELFERPLNLSYDLRTTQNAEAKRSIAQAAAELIQDGTTIFISIGTTPMMVADALKTKKQLTVITNNLNAAMALSTEQSNRLILPGGEVRLPDRDILGDEVVALFNSHRAEVGIFGVAGIDEDGSLLDFHNSEVKVREKIRENCRLSILVADASKFGRAAPVVGGNISDVDRVIIDKSPQEAFAGLISELGARVEISGSYG
ncbi:MAG: DeoR/GlpR family DNA-binding transcription regulator [Pseudomonadota bacterium]